MARGPRFTPEEDELIRKYYTSEGTTTLLKLLPTRSSSSIRIRANKYLSLRMTTEAKSVLFTRLQEETFEGRIREIVMTKERLKEVFKTEGKRVKIKSTTWIGI